MFYAATAVIYLVGITAIAEYLTLAQNNNYLLVRGRRFWGKWLENAAVGLLFAISVFIKGYCFEYAVHIFTLCAVFIAFFDITRYFARRVRLKRTKRAQVYFITDILLYTVVTVPCFLNTTTEIVCVLICCAELLLLPVGIKIVESVLNVIFEKKNEKFVLKMAEKLKKSPTKLIAVTGSFAKTSCKMILCEMLSEKYKVAYSEKNYNTPLGVALSIEKLKGDEDYFIAEFGARHVNDIETLCHFFNPDYGIITGVCEQHIGVFGSFHAIYNEKFKLAKHIDGEGLCVFGKNRFAQKMYCEFDGQKRLAGDNFRISDIAIGVGKTSFYIENCGKTRRIDTKLIAQQAVENILTCAELAFALGVSFENITTAIERLKPIPHRLEYRYCNGIHILDDGYNGNEEGVRFTLECISAYPRPRVIVAQGFVESGIKQKEKNMLLGRQIASRFDIVLLCGINKNAIKTGLKKEEFVGKVIECKNIEDVTKKLRDVLKSGMTLYLQNDLPDIF